MTSKHDNLIIGGHEFTSRFMLGSGKYSPELIKAAVSEAGAQIITIALRRANSRTDSILEHIPQSVTLLPKHFGGAHGGRGCAHRAARARVRCGDLL